MYLLQSRHFRLNKIGGHALRHSSVGLMLMMAVMLLPNSADADLISYWHFNDWSGSNTDRTIVADSGIAPGTLTVDADWTEISNSGMGTTQNQFGGTPAGAGLTMLDPVNDGSSDLGFNIELDTTGFGDLVLSWAERRDALGYQMVETFYSTDGGTSFTANVPTNAPGTSYSTFTTDMSSVVGLNDNANVVIRFQFSQTLDDGSNVGRNILDNIQFNANFLSDGPPATPEPSVIIASTTMMLGFGTTYWRKRRKKKAGEKDSSAPEENSLAS